MATLRKANPQKGGRPTVYTEKIGKKLAALKARGVSIQKACETYDDLPHPDTAYAWLAENRFPTFSEMYRRACARDDMRNVDTLLEDADAPPPMMRTERETKDGRLIVEERIDPVAPNLLKHRMAIRQWWLARRLPDQFGDFLHLVK